MADAKIIVLYHELQWTLEFRGGCTILNAMPGFPKLIVQILRLIMRHANAFRTLQGSVIHINDSTRTDYVYEITHDKFGSISWNDKKIHASGFIARYV